MREKKLGQRATYEKVRDMVLDKMSGDLHEILRKPMNSVTVSATVGDLWNRMFYIRGQDASGVLVKIEPVGVAGCRDGLNIYGRSRAVELLASAGFIKQKEVEMFNAELHKEAADADLRSELALLEVLAKKHGYTRQKA
jgi:hypothetical protein